MKIRHPQLIRFAALAASQTIKAWMSTLRFQYRPLGPDVEPANPQLPGRFIYAFWHENILIPAYQYRAPNVNVLISQHADGEIIAQTAQRLGFNVVRGSTTRGGIQAVRQLVRQADQAHIVVTPDGPRGPRRVVQDGLLFLAARTGLPIVPVGIGMDRPWRAGSWDRMALPRPWSQARCVAGTPIVVPEKAGRDQLAVYRQQVQDAMLDVTALAEEWASTGCWPEASCQQAAA